MSDSPASIGISTRALEVFSLVASTGSLQKAAQSLGMSAPSASQQLRKLEATLGYPLIDHTRRPLEPTQAGYTYLVHVREALGQLRQGAIAISLNDLSQLRRLRLGVIDDLDSDITPMLVTSLARMLESCDLSLMTAPSHDILQGLAADSLDFGVAARPQNPSEALVERILLRDPFVMAVPRGLLSGAPDHLPDNVELPFLRYSERQLIGRQIATELGWRKIDPFGKITLDSNQVLFGLVADGQGWAITTALGYARARRFQDKVDIHPLPFVGFSRVISLFHLEGWHNDVPEIIASSMRESLLSRVVGPTLAKFPWLGEAWPITE